MTHIPVEIMIADVTSLVFLTLGAAFLIRLFLRFGSKRSRVYSVTMCALIMLFAFFHEGLEIVHSLYEADTGLNMLCLTALISTLYFATAFLLRREIRGLLEFRRGKDG